MVCGVTMRKCCYCKEELPPRKDCINGYQRAGFCDIDCMTCHGIDKAKAQRERQQRKKQREAKERVKTKGEHAREAQAAFNAWIRERDRGQPCISCDKPDDGTHQRHASHYRSRGACPELAFEPLNVHASCAQCNAIKSGNIVEYRLRLIKKIGQEAVDWLEGPHEPRRYTVEELKAIKSEYRAKVREMKRY